jgi:hypothetical protein
MQDLLQQIYKFLINMTQSQYDFFIYLTLFILYIQHIILFLFFSVYSAANTYTSTRDEHVVRTGDK